MQYIILKWVLAFLVGLLTGVIATLINLAVENISGYKLLTVVGYIQQERLEQTTLPYLIFVYNEKFWSNLINDFNISCFFLIQKL